MSLVTQINSLITRIGTEFKTTKTLISGNTTGDLSGLSTTAKTNLIAAINELQNGFVTLNGAVNKNKGWYATSAALITAFPTASAGDYAIVGATDTVWIWDTDGTPAWKDGDMKGAVTSVNGLTGAVVIPQVTTSVNGLMIAADKTKLNGIATGATANDTDTNLKNRANHTGTQLAATISDFATNVLSTVLAGFSAATNAAVTATDSIVAAIGKLQSQINGHFGQGGAAHANAVTGGAAGFMTGADKSKLDGVAAGATANSTDAVLKDRANHTGSQLAATISNFAAATIAQLLTGLSVATSTVVTATDSILIAIGKLQAQNTAHTGSGGTAHADVTTTVDGFMIAADKVKLDGIAAGATANSTDAVLKARANHTGTQLASTISDFASGVIAQVLTGLSVASAVAIAATDSILIAVGKLQAQITAHVGSGGAAHANAVAAGAAGFMTGADKTKLDGLSNYTHPTGDGNLHVPATSTTNNLKVLKAGATAGVMAWGNVAFSELTGVPTTLAGHGITDAYTKAEIGDPTTDFVAAFNLAIA